MLITILDNITETSMPYNEFVLYRSKHFTDEKQVLIICRSNSDIARNSIPKNIETIYAGRNIINIRRVIKQVIYKCEQQNIPYIIHIHQVQSGFLAEMAMIGSRFRKKVVFTVHNTFSGYKFHNKILSFINALFAYRIVCVSNTSYNEYPQVIRHMKGNRIIAIQNGVDTERIDAIIRSNEKHMRDSIIFTYVARFVPVKNHSFLIDVLEKCDRCVHFKFIGLEDEKREIRTKAKEKGIENRITFTGLIPRDDVYKELFDSDYYISSSTLEGLPVSVLEAMYCGLPCVLSDIPQHKELASRETIILPLDIETWVREINRMAQMQQEQKLELKQRTIDYVKSKFSLSKMHERYNDVYESIDGGKSNC